MNIKLILIVLSLIVANLSYTQVQAAAFATGTQAGGFSVGAVYGYTILTTQTFQITALGYKELGGTWGNNPSRTVSLWKSPVGSWGYNSSVINTLLSTINVVKNGPTSFLSGGYWYTPLATPVTITPGYYTVAASEPSFNSVFGTWSQLTNGINITQYITGDSTSIQSNVFAFTNGRIPIAPNFWLATPEPATYLMLGSLIAISAVILYKRRKLA